MSEPMQWISMRQRKPTEADLPIVVGGHTRAVAYNLSSVQPEDTHWFPLEPLPGEEVRR